jgi:hypothetical protein
MQVREVQRAQAAAAAAARLESLSSHARRRLPDSTVECIHRFVSFIIHVFLLASLHSMRDTFESLSKSLAWRSSSSLWPNTSIHTQPGLLRDGTDEHA